MNLKACIMGMLLSAVLLNGSISFADTMKCGTRLVSDGDSKAKVLLRCGEPFMKEFVGEKTVRSRLYGGYGIKFDTVQVERWTYVLGQRQFMRILTFEADTLVKIELGDKP
jgi:hypothetical protein